MCIENHDHPVKSIPSTSHPQRGFRLNKHFQPEYLYSYDFFVVEIPVDYIYKDIRKQPPYVILFFSSPHLEVQFLRGPPGGMI